MDPKIGRTHTTFYAQAEPAAADAGADAAPAKDAKDAKDAKSSLGPIGGGGANYKFTAAIKLNKDGYPEPEKDFIPDPKIDRAHTTFYAQADPVAAAPAAAAPAAAAPAGADAAPAKGDA